MSEEEVALRDRQRNIDLLIWLLFLGLWPLEHSAFLISLTLLPLSSTLSLDGSDSSAMPTPLRAPYSPGQGQKAPTSKPPDLPGAHLSWHFDIRFRHNRNPLEHHLLHSLTCHHYDIILIQMRLGAFCFLICLRWHFVDGPGQACE